MNDKANILYELGDPRELHKDLNQWPDYTKYGFTEADIPLLIVQVGDKTFNQLPSDNKAVWVPLHAWRILGQLQSSDAIQVLIETFDDWEEDDWALSELPTVMGMMGSSAIAPLAQYIKEANHAEYARVIAFDGLKEIALTHPDSRAEILGIYREYMSSPDTNAVSLNGLLIASLLDLQAVELIDDIRGMFEQGSVDWSIAGDLEEVEIELGLRTERSIPRPNFAWMPGLSDEINSGNSETLVRQTGKVGRNDPCPCGSGKKYKRCCLN